MFWRKALPCLALVQVLWLSGARQIRAQDPVQPASPGAESTLNADDGGSSSESSTELLRSIRPDGLRALFREVLERNPEIARSERVADAAALRAPQVRAWPDPVAALSLFALPPETRTGAQRLSTSIQQKLPWLGKHSLREQAALFAAAAAFAEVETLRLDKLTAARKLAHELAFLEAYEGIVTGERSTLERYEKAAQARYAAGTGLQQGIVRIQAQITRADTRLLEISERRSALSARLNRLRDRPASTPIDSFGSGGWKEPLFDAAALGEIARAHRPELAAASSRIAEGETNVELARKDYRPDFTVGLSYTAVERRDDLAAGIDRPDGDGRDILALSGSVNLPIRRKKLEAGLEEALARRSAAEDAKRSVLADIESTIGDLTTRIPLLFEHLTLLETVLRRQAREALRSAETAYSTGKLNAVDLLDAEVVLFEVQIATARTRMDLAVAWAELERAVGQPVEPSRE